MFMFLEHGFLSSQVKWTIDRLNIVGQIDPTLFSIAAMVALFSTIRSVDPDAAYAFFSSFVTSIPYWLPLALLPVLWVSWVRYVRFQFLSAQQKEKIVLEIELPPEVDKSPLAMEVFLTSLWNNGGETTWIQRLLQGRFRAIWSLEIASNEGRISFYIRLNKDWRSIVEARLYGQFPEAKVREVEDYTTKVPFNLEEYDLYSSEFKKGGIDALPIKTYVDYKLDRDPKEEYKIDPITHILELMSQIGKDEYYWVQFIIKARKRDEWFGIYDPWHDSFTDPAKAEIKNITTKASKRSSDVAKEVTGNTSPMAQLTEGERTRIEAIESSLSKLVFETGIRVLYMGKKERFTGVNIGGLIRFFDTYRGDSSQQRNGLGVSRDLVEINYPWQDFMDIRRDFLKRRSYIRYRDREFFYVPYDQVPVFMTTEELASLWHFPSSIVKTPGLNRVAARRSEAPENLPTVPQ